MDYPNNHGSGYGNGNNRNRNNASFNEKVASLPDTQLSAANIYTSGVAYKMALHQAEFFSCSTIVPKEYQGNAANCLIALEVAHRFEMSPMMAMQNLYIVNGRPAWSSQFMVAMINKSKKYKSELQYEISGSGDTLSCFAYAIDKNDKKIIGPTIDMKMAQAEGWLTKNGSKWKTMPEVMITYRAASFFGRRNCPDVLLGIYTDDEVIELSESQYMVKDAQTVDLTADEIELTINETSPLQDEDGTTNGYNNAPSPQNHPDAHMQSPPPVTSAVATELTCADCGAVILQAEHDFSINKYGRALCRKCQKVATNK